MIDWKSMSSIFLAIVAASLVLRWLEGRRTTKPNSTVTPPTPQSTADWVRSKYPNATSV